MSLFVALCQWVGFCVLAGWFAILELLRMKAQREGTAYVRVGNPPILPGVLTPAAKPGQTKYVYHSSEPITLRIPWSALVSDNDKFVAKRRGE